MGVQDLINPTPGPFYLVLGTYFVIMALLGWVASRHSDTLSDFFVMSGKAGAVVSGIAYFSTQYSMSTFMGVPAITYKAGYAGMSISVPGLVFSMIIPALFVGRKLLLMGHRYGFLTTADYLGDRYESDAIRVLHAVLIVLFLVPMIGAQTIGAGLITHTYTGLPEWVGIAGMGTLVILYCMAGGIRGAMLTDVVQGGLMLCTAVATFWVSLDMGGGLEAINSALAAKNTALLSHPGANGAFPWANYASMIVMWSFFTIGQPTLFTKFFAMRDYRVLFKAVILGTLGMLCAATLIEWSGVNAIVSVTGLEGKQTDFIVPIILQKGFSPVIASLFIAGIMAAGMSTIDSLLIVATGGITRDIYQNVIHKEATDREVLDLSRWVTVGIGALGIAFGIMRPGGIFQLILFAFGGLAMWVTPLLFGMYWRKATLAGAFASILSSTAVYVAFKLKYIPTTFGFDPVIPSWLFGVAIMVVVSLMSRPVSEACIKKHFDDLAI